MGVEIGTLFTFSWESLILLFIAASLAGTAETLAIWAVEAKTTEVEAGRTTVRRDTAPLARYLDPLVVKCQARTPGMDLPLRRMKLRAGRDRLLSPWAIAHLASVIAAALFGLQFLQGIDNFFRGSIVSILFVLGWLGIAIVSININARIAVILACIFAALTGTAGWMMYGPHAAIAPIAVCALLLIHLVDRLSSHDDFVLGARPIITRLVYGLSVSVRLALQLLFGNYSAEKVFGRFGAKRDRAPDFYS
jgi:hypothetical protein